MFVAENFTGVPGKMVNIEDILVDVEDLPLKSNVHVDCTCDYCQSLIKIRYCDYDIKVRNSVVQKVSCKNCRIKKVAESNMVKYNQVML